MAAWEDELAVLLRNLGVTQEESKSHPQPIRHSEASLHKADGKRREQSADALFWNDTIDNDAWLTDLSAMRREVDSIVDQVIRLMQQGELEKSLKEDVMVVVRALRRRATVTQQAAASDEAYLESVAAMLHFCRLVLRLSESASEEW